MFQAKTTEVHVACGFTRVNQPKTALVHSGIRVESAETQGGDMFCGFMPSVTETRQEKKFSQIRRSRAHDCLRVSQVIIAHSADPGLEVCDRMPAKVDCVQCHFHTVLRNKRAIAWHLLPLLDHV
jgi:hypothetical protein